MSTLCLTLKLNVERLIRGTMAHGPACAESAHHAWLSTTRAASRNSGVFPDAALCERAVTTRAAIY